MLNNNSSGLIPECMIQIADNTYKCQNFGFIVKTEILPIKCFLCNPQGLQVSYDKPHPQLPVEKPKQKTLVCEAIVAATSSATTICNSSVSEQPFSPVTVRV